MAKSAAEIQASKVATQKAEFRQKSEYKSKFHQGEKYKFSIWAKNSAGGIISKLKRLVFCFLLHGANNIWGAAAGAKERLEGRRKEPILSFDNKQLT